VIDHFYDSPYKLAFLTSDLKLQTPVPSDIAQGVLILFVSLPTLFFLRRRKKTPRIEKAPVETPAPKRAPKPKFSLQQKMRPILISINPANWQITQDAGRGIQKLFSKTRKTTTRSKSVRSSKPRTATKAKSVSTPRKTATVKTKKTTRKKPASAKLTLPRKARRKANNLNDVKLTSEEEHVCPYCLEEVHKNDSRGVVICEVCGTWHHKDCWDLTGTCGVAHRNEL
jgi:ribosomal protein L37AE/L43A